LIKGDEKVGVELKLSDAPASSMLIAVKGWTKFWSPSSEGGEMNSYRLPALGLFSALMVCGCLFSNDKKGFTCNEKGLIRSDPSNWFEYSDSMTIQSKYPFRFEIKVYNDQMKLVNTSSSEIDSLMFERLGMDNPNENFAIKWLPIESNGNPLPSGCYQLTVTTHAMYQERFTNGDFPNTTDQGIAAEYILQYIRESP
jgi:hypothetical protein